MVALTGTTSSCSRCKRADVVPPDARGVVPSRPAPALPTLTFAPPLGTGGYGLPSGCTITAPVIRIWARGDRIRVGASSGAPDEIIVGYESGQQEGGSLFAHGIVPLTKPDAARDIAWLDSRQNLLFAATDGRWMTLQDAEAQGPFRQVILEREGEGMQRLAVGDRLRAADLLCAGETCAALTTRVAEVEQPGATLFVGTPGTAPSKWTRTDLESGEGGAAYPLVITNIAPEGGQVDVTLAAAQHVLAYRWHADGVVQKTHQVPSRHGALDAALVGGHLMVASLGTPINDRGCAKDWTSIAVETSDSGQSVIPTASPARSATLRPLGRGAILTWHATASCEDNEHWAVQAVLLSGEGKPTGKAIPVGDATSYALWTRGDQLQLALAHREWITVVRAKCE
jgi:hypothetical protein